MNREQRWSGPKVTLWVLTIFVAIALFVSLILTYRNDPIASVIAPLIGL